MKATSKAEPSFAAALSRARRWDHLELLERIDACGSISAAAQAIGMSYKGAWQALESMNNLAEQPLVARQTGGRHGGGTQLTAYGRRVLGAFRAMEAERQRVFAALGGTLDDFDDYYHLIRRFDMKTSARNQFLGRIRTIRRGAVNSEVLLDIGGGDEIVAVVTNDSVEHLALAEGVEACALVKAPWVIVSTDESVRTSARNRLAGTVVRCQEGAVNGEVVIELPGGKLVVATITNESIHELGIVEGCRAVALIKASHVILAVAA